MEKSGYKQTELGLIPNDWNVSRFGNLVDIYRGGSPRPIQDYITDSVDGVNWIKIGDVKPLEKYIRNTLERIKPSGKSMSREVHKGDFILSNSMSFGRPYILDIDGCIHDGWLTIQNYEESFDKDFLFYFLSSNIVIKQYLSMAAGSSVQNLNKEKVADLNVFVFDKEEQKAIVGYLSNVDELIFNQEKLIEKKKAIKQGVMQELLTGKKRLNGFNNEWNKYPLSFWFDYSKGNGLSKEKIQPNGKYDCILYGELFTQYSEIINDVVSKTNSEEGVLSQRYDVLFPCSTTTNGRDLATASVIMKDNVLLGGDIGIYRRKQDIDTRFFGYLVPSLVDEIVKYTQGLTIVHLKAEEMLKMEVLMPSDVKEQTAIADVLADMDNEIFGLEQKLEKYKQLKQAMMEQLLTGKIRLV